MLRLVCCVIALSALFVSIRSGPGRPVSDHASATSTWSSIRPTILCCRATSTTSSDYVENNNYNSSWINRADTGFVLQMGGFYSHTKRPPPTIDQHPPVRHVRARRSASRPSEIGLSNTVGTVALALPGPADWRHESRRRHQQLLRQPHQQHVPRSRLHRLRRHPRHDGRQPDHGADDRSTEPRTRISAPAPATWRSADVPVQDNGQQVFVKRAFLIDDTLAVARAMAGIESTMATSAASFDGGSDLASLSAISVVPEPSTAVLLFLNTLGLLKLRFRRR